MKVPALKPYHAWKSLLGKCPKQGWVSGGMDFMAAYEYERDLRSTNIATCGFPILTLETVDALAYMLKGQRVVEVGCGSGYLAYHLIERGINVTTVDDARTKYIHGKFDRPYTGVVRETARRWIKPDFQAVIMSWPDYKSRIASDVARLMHKGQLLIYQGESHYGCTANDLFFRRIDNEEEFQYMQGLTTALNKHHLAFDGIHDRWEVYMKRKST